jgi:hypothetical protein
MVIGGQEKLVEYLYQKKERLSALLVSSKLISAERGAGHGGLS